MVLLTEIGIAAGLSSFDPHDRAAGYLIGAGVFGALAVILGFFAGGLVSSYLARHVRTGRAAFQGALVWAVAVPVLGFLGAMLALGTMAASGTVATAANTAPRTPGEVPRAPGEPPLVEPTANRPVTPRDTQAAVNAAGAVGWAMVAGLLLALGAAAGGGAAGAAIWARRARSYVAHDLDRPVAPPVE
jgi:hypothetical protein